AAGAAGSATAAMSAGGRAGHDPAMGPFETAVASPEGPAAQSEATSGAPPAPPRPLYAEFFRGLLDYSIRFPWITVILAAVCLGASGWVFDRNVVRGVLWGGGSGLQ